MSTGAGEASGAVHERLRRLPAVSRVLELLGRHPAASGVAPEVVTELVRHELEVRRRAVLAGSEPPEAEAVAQTVAERLVELFEPSLRPVINATGVILHTNLGRAPLSEEAVAAMALAARSYTNLEYDLESGERGSRHVHPAAILRQLTGAEDALVVNNNAGAVLLALITLAQGREVIVSRGQAVEIGGGVRIPEILAQSGARLREVGTTNRTYIHDYASAISQDTALILRVHCSNFRLIGFVHETPLEELVALGEERGIPVLDDLGSGALLDTAQFGLSHEPMPQESLAAGADLVMFSGDKLLGGPQAGIIVGRADLIETLKRHPLARAIRADKLVLASLSATLTHYVRGEALEKIPVWRMISLSPAAIRARAEAWAAAVPGEVVPAESTVGGGSLPGDTLPTWAFAPHVAQPNAAAARLRAGDPPLIARVADDRLLLDPRTVLPEQDALVIAALKEL